MRLKTYKELLRALCKRYGGEAVYAVVAEPNEESPLWEMSVSYRCGDLVRLLAKDKARRKRDANERAAERALVCEINAIRSFPGRLGTEKGRVAEERVLRTLNERLDIMPGWIKGATGATKQQDANHVDVIVHTDIGDLQLQVKSSEVMKRRFLKKYWDLDIAVVVVRPVDSDDVVFRNTLAAIRTLYQKVRNRRRKA